MQKVLNSNEQNSTYTISVAYRVDCLKKGMYSLQEKLARYLNPVENSIFADVLCDLIETRDEEVLKYDTLISWCISINNFSRVICALHRLFNDQREIYYYVKGVTRCLAEDIVTIDGQEYCNETETGDSYELYKYLGPDASPIFPIKEVG